MAEASYAISLITEPPIVTSAEQHAIIQASTPTTFDHPPVLRLEQTNVRLQLKPAIQDYAEGAADEGQKGDLYITHASLCFFSPTTNKGISVPYPAIALHAVSRHALRPWQPATEGEEAPLDGVGLAGGPCVYCQIDETGGVEPEGDEEDDSGGSMRDLVITPDDASAVERIFEAISHCASLHPSFMNDGDDDAFTGLGEQADDEELDEVGRAARAHLESLIDYNSIPAGFIPRDGSDFDEEEEAARTEDATEDADGNAVQPAVAKLNGVDAGR